MDQRRGKIFAKLLRGVEVAARAGGGNPDANPTLADAIQRARDSSVPSDNIERAIKRATGTQEGVTYETLVYEGYAPGGVAVIVEVLTDNRNRAAADVRRIFSKHGGSLGEPGSVSWMFSKRAVLLVSRNAADEDEIMNLASEAGAEDLQEEGELWEVTGPPETLDSLRRAFERSEVPIESARLSMQPSSTIPLEAAGAGKVLALLDELEDSDDVQEIYSNFDVPDEVMSELS